MRISTIAAAVALIISSTSSADPIDQLIGQWVSPDGYARQTIEKEFDGSWLSTRMWFRSNEGWRLVATGSIYRKPQIDHWFAVSRTTDMDGIELFESTLDATGVDRFEIRNTARKSDGSSIRTTEVWHFHDVDRYSYTVFRVDGSARTPWLKGSWVRLMEDR